MSRILLIVVGVFQALEGLSAISRNDLLVVTYDYAYKLNVSTWRWIHLLVSLGLAVVSVAILSGAIWARIVGIGVVALSAVAQFLWSPYYPVWAVLVIALDVAIIWALTVHDTRMTS